MKATALKELRPVLFVLLHFGSIALFLLNHPMIASVFSVSALVGFLIALTLEMVQKYKTHESGTFSCVFLATILFAVIPNGGFFLAFHDNSLLIAPGAVGVLTLFVYYNEIVEYFTETKISWKRSLLAEHSEEVPLFVLNTAIEIHRRLPRTEFYIEKVVSDVYIPNPFLIARDPISEREFYVAVWDEPKFEAEHR